MPTSPLLLKIAHCTRADVGIGPYDHPCARNFMLNKLQAVVNKYEELCFKSEQPDFYADPKGSQTHAGKE